MQGVKACRDGGALLNEDGRVTAGAAAGGKHGIVKGNARGGADCGVEAVVFAQDLLQVFQGLEALEGKFFCCGGKDKGFLAEFGPDAWIAG